MVERKKMLNVMGNCVQNGAQYSSVGRGEGYHTLTRERLLEAGLTEDDIKIPHNKYTTAVPSKDLAGRDILAIACHKELGCVVYFERDGECRNVGRSVRQIGTDSRELPVDWAIPKKVSRKAIEHYGWDARDFGQGD